MENMKVNCYENNYESMRTNYIWSNSFSEQCFQSLFELKNSRNFCSNLLSMFVRCAVAASYIVRIF